MRKLRESDRNILARVFKDHGTTWVYHALLLWYGGKTTINELGKSKRWTHKTLAAFRFLRELVEDYTLSAIYNAADAIEPPGRKAA
jgi:hypothetical protein